MNRDYEFSETIKHLEPGVPQLVKNVHVYTGLLLPVPEVDSQLREWTGPMRAETAPGIGDGLPQIAESR